MSDKQLTRTAQHWFITGGCGFIGRNLITRLLQNGHQVSAYDNFSVGSEAELRAYLSETRHGAGSTIADLLSAQPSRLRVLQGDINDANRLAEVLGGGERKDAVNVIVHLAAQTGVPGSVEDPMFDCVSNVVGTLNVLMAAKNAQVSRLVFASSGAPVGAAEPPIHEEIATHPTSPYGASKLAGEAYCSAWSASFGLPCMALRFGNVYGPGSDQKGSVVARFIQQALAGDNWEIYGDGSQTRDFVYVGDLVDAIIQAGTIPQSKGDLFQIATAAETTVNELVTLLCTLLEKNGVTAPQVSFTETRPGEVHRNYSDTRKAQRLLNWSAETALADGLDTTLRWFLSRN